MPADLSTFLAVQSLKRKLGPNDAHKVGEVLSGYSAKGGASGGTLASGMNLLEAGTKEELEIARNGFALSPSQFKDVGQQLKAANLSVCTCSSCQSQNQTFPVQVGYV